MAPARLRSASRTGDVAHARREERPQLSPLSASPRLLVLGVCGPTRRRLVLVVRETPLSAVHLRNMLAVTEAGGVVVPPVPAFYLRPASLEDVITHVVARALDPFGLDVTIPRWGEDE